MDKSQNILGQLRCWLTLFDAKVHILKISCMIAALMVPPLNQTLWMLLVVSLTIGAAWLGLLLTAEQNGFWEKRSDDRSRPRRP